MNGALLKNRPILVVEDDESTAELTRRSLVRASRAVRGARRVDEALRLMSSERFGLAILDYRLEDGVGWPVLEAARASSPPIPVIVVTAAGDERVAAEALHRGAAEYLIKTGAFWEQLPGLVERIASVAEAEARSALLAAVVRFSDDAIFSESLAGEVRSWNPAAERLFGYSAHEITGRSAALLLPPGREHELEEVIATVAAGGHVVNRETVRQRKDGSLVDVAESVSPMEDVVGATVGLAVVVRDITEQKQLEAQFRQAQKMEAVGRLAGGIAHDFNNLITVITGYSELLLARLAAGDPSRKAVRDIRQAGERAAGLTRQLLAFSRKKLLAPRVLDLNGVIEGMGSMLRPMLGEDVVIVLHKGAPLHAVFADRGQVEQVIANLAVNARDAMPEGGQLTISTENVAIGPEDSQAHPKLTPGRYAMVEVADNGEGMSPETLAHLYEPFFTTKPPGKGTGLGLSTVHGIVQRCGGCIEVQSELGHGTAFRVYFPRTERTEREWTSEVSYLPRRRETGTILVADDDPGVRNLIHEVLMDSGFEVLMARDGEHALALCRAHARPTDLLLTDIVMHRMRGPELAAEVRRLHPRARVVYMSGYADTPPAPEDTSAMYLDKPFTPASLLSAIHEALDVPPST